MKNRTMLAKYRALALCSLGLYLSLPVQASSFTFVTFDVPGAKDTEGQRITSTGTIAGRYFDSNGAAHAFLRSPDGVITTFDAPGAGTLSGQGTEGVDGINRAGAATGHYIDSNGARHGYVRSPAGIFTSFDAPGAGTGPNQGTRPAGISAAGTIAGYYIVGTTVHSFLRDSQGNFTTIDVPNSQGTLASNIDESTGAVTGSVFEGHGFLRTSQGTFISFDAAASTTPQDVNLFGAVAGNTSSADQVLHGFLRDPNGVITIIDAPGAGTDPGFGTSAATINAKGEVAGSMFDSNGVTHGYLRDANGVITVFEAPGAGTQAHQGTHVATVESLNGGSAITGTYVDANNREHAYVREPVVAPPVTTALRFVPVTPCRVADTRNATGTFGAPSIAGQTSRDFPIPNSACGIPSTAAAYSLNVAVVPAGTLGYLTLWPTGQPQPLASILNSLDGRIKSNAAIVPAGSDGAITVYVTDTTDLVLDINGYFVPDTTPAALAFFPLTPCRIADTRSSTGPLGGPGMTGQRSRTFPLLSSPCNVPQTAKAYSLNVTAVPPGPLGYLTVWPTGEPQPVVASLNALTGTITGNAVIVPAGLNGTVDVFATDNTDLVIDINGYFAPPATGGLSLFNLPPCRVVDTRQPPGALPRQGSSDVNVTASGCGAPPAARAFVFSVTVVPPGPLGFLSMWPQGQPQPEVATLNALDGAISSNMAIVPTMNGLVSAFASDLTYLILDLNGYFAP